MEGVQRLDLKPFVLAKATESEPVYKFNCA